MNKEKGITLIALIITIIVLLILAAVSIATLTGENGLLTQVDKAGTETKNVTEEEQVKLAYNKAITENKGAGVTKKQLEDELKKYDKGVTVEETKEGFSVKFQNGNAYTVENSGTVEKTIEKLAKDTLNVNTEAGEETKDYERSSYVKYNNILCRTLYNDDIHGLQIISANNVAKVTLGENDTNKNVKADDFIYEGNESSYKEATASFKKAAASYNRAVDTLNEKAKEYMLKTDKIVIDARCLGSDATLANNLFQGDPTTEKSYVHGIDNPYFKSFDNLFKKSDYQYKEDADPKTGQLKKLGLTISDDVWLASRSASGTKSSTSVCIRTITDEFEIMNYSICQIEKVNYVMRGNSWQKSFRPVFLLSSETKIMSGEGTEESPYELSI